MPSNRFKLGQATVTLKVHLNTFKTIASELGNRAPACTTCLVTAARSPDWRLKNGVISLSVDSYRSTDLWSL